MVVESLKKSGIPHLRCLDVFLVASIVFLFLAVAVVTVGVGLLLLGTKLQPPSLNRDETRMENFAYLEATKSALNNGNMTWAAVHNGALESVGSLFVFHAKQDAIELKRSGYYFLYVDLKFNCTYKCDAAGPLTVRIGNYLTCTVELPKRTDGSVPFSQKCWQVARIDAAKPFVTRMTVPENTNNWILDMAKQGIFLVE